jgi:hypothetical protein
LAFCAVSIDIDKDYPVKINIWKTINTLGTDKSTCSGFLKNGNNCVKLSNYTCNEKYYCKMHIPDKRSFKKIKQKKCNNFTLQEIALNVIGCIDNLYNENTDIFNQLDKVLIELQPRVNNKMKFVSHIIFGKFTELLKDKKSIIRFVAAKNKLKNFQGPVFETDVKSKYSQRKKASVYYCKWYLDNYFIDSEKQIWSSYLEENKKADDLADTFNMCIQEYNIKKSKK